jgi:PIN domain nuclease of toxin-antitoxin system
VRLLVDTHPFLWAIASPERLSARARRAIEDDANEILVSAASAWEIAIKFSLGRLQLPDDPQRFIPEQLAANSFTALAVLLRHALQVADLPMIHKDPFDRLLVAQAVIEDLALVTSDAQLRKYPVKTIW